MTLKGGIITYFERTDKIWKLGYEGYRKGMSPVPTSPPWTPGEHLTPNPQSLKEAEHLGPGHLTPYLRPDHGEEAEQQ